MAKKTRKRGLGAAAGRTTAISLKRMGNDLKQPAIVLGGILGTALIDKMGLSKISALSPGTSKLSQFYKPAVIIGLGLIGRQMSKNTMIKSALDGMTIYGSIKAVDAATGKSVMEGLQGLKGFQPYRDVNYQLPAMPAEPVNGMPR